MIQFKYKVLKDGVLTEGVREASDKLALAGTLEKEGFVVVYVEEKKKRRLELGGTISFLSRVGMHEKIMFARNLGAMIDAGLSMTRALSVMERQTKKGKLKDVLGKIGGEIAQGKTLSESMKGFPDVFAPLFVSMVRAGEESGNLAGSLRTVSLQMEKSYELSRKIRGALIYPAVILTIMAGIGVVMLVYVVPTLTSTFKELNVKLPITTRFIIGISDFLRNNYILILIASVFLAAGAYYFARSKMGNRLFDWVLLKLPVFKGMVKEVNSARTARTLSSLLSSGVEVVVALNVTRDVLQNSYYKEVLDKAGAAIEKGKPISSIFAEREDLYPLFVSEMISVGEETGKIGDMLVGVSEFYEDEVDQKTKNLSTIIEPFLMVIIGAAVGFFALSMLAPTYSLVDAI